MQGGGGNTGSYCVSRGWRTLEKEGGEQGEWAEVGQVGSIVVDEVDEEGGYWSSGYDEGGPVFGKVDRQI